MNWFKRAFSLLAVLVAVMIAVSCTTERDAVDKSPELSLDKRLFEGEFFLRQTVVDIPYTVDYSFIGESNDGKVVKWKITENWLIAYSVWDNLTTVDTNEITDTNETPVLAFPIAEHYDIVPMENPTTGEALPVLTTNTDRPWNERRYFQLATSTQSGINTFEYKYLNLTLEWGAPFKKTAVDTATDWEFYAHDGTFISPKKYREYTAISDDKERFNKEVEWLQFTSTEYLAPVNDWSEIYSWADIEEFIGSEPAGMTHRFVLSKINRDVVGKRDYDLATKSFLWKKGSKDNGFRPLEYPDELFREYGYFTNKFKGYDNYHGYREDNYHTLANHFNIAWADANKNWNFKCDDGEDYDKCLNKLKYQQKVVFMSSPKTPLRMLPANCSITKDYNYAMLAARYAAMKPGSDTREFDQWYVNTFSRKNHGSDASFVEGDFFTEVTASDGSKVYVRDTDWYVDAVTNTDNYYHDKWENICFIPESQAWIQKWDGSFVDENGDADTNEKMDELMAEYKNQIVVMVKNPVEAYLPDRDGQSLYGYSNYYNLSSDSRENAVKICVDPAEAALYDGKKAMTFETCYKNNDEMTALYVDQAGEAEWRGDRWDCKIYDEDEACPDNYVAAKAACVLTEERTCETEDDSPVLRHKYDNGNPYGALINWVEKPTEYGILGVSQWNVNPETGMSLGGGSNIAGSVLAWATTRAVEMARMIISKDDQAAWDWEDLINPDYANYPSVIYDNSPAEMKSVGAKDYNTMKMVRKSTKNMSKEEYIKYVNDTYQSKTTNYGRFDYSDIKGSTWESDMVPYSIKKALFPWSDPSANPTYTDAERDMMSPWYSGPEAMEAEMLKYIDAKAMDFDFDESFMDGSIVQFIKDKQNTLRAEYEHWDNEESSDYQKYSDALIYSIYNELETLMYKGVAEHEMGHTLGLRHNFIGSTDITNYKDEFYASRNYPAMMEGVKNLLLEEQQKSTYNPASFGMKAYRYKKSFESDINYYTYTSVMDYQRAAYIHSMGLGKYDLAALKFVYGRSIEKVKTIGDGDYGILVVQGGEGDSNDDVTVKLNPLRDPNEPDFVKVNAPYIWDDITTDTECNKDAKCDFDYVCDSTTKKCRTNAGELMKVENPSKIQIYYEDGKKVTRLVPKTKLLATNKLETDDNGKYTLDYDCDDDDEQVECSENLTYLVNDGRHYEYLFESDEKSSDDPRVNTFDEGYLASDVIRGMRDMDDMFYYLRFFQRGNPQFREFRGRTSMKMIYDTLFNKYKYIHFLLDFNFYAYGKWAPYLMDLNQTNDTDECLDSFPVATGLNSGEEITVNNYICSEYQRAIRGEEYWIDDKSGELRYLTPMSPADYVVGGMEGINYFFYDVLYRPAVGEYLTINNNYDPDIKSKLDSAQIKYWQTSDNYLDGLSDVGSKYGFSFIDIPATIGRYQRDHYDIQDNEDIYYDKVLRRGFAEEKMVAIYAITNSGWFDAKYRRESRANSVDQMFEGLENVKFAMLGDVMNEESLFSFSPYCYDTLGEKIIKADVPVNMLTNYAVEPPFIKGASASYTPNKNICAMLSNDGRYEPIHAGWTYFDKMWPMYFAMGNVANTSADTSVYNRFVSYKIPVYERQLYDDPDVNEIEFLNKDEDHYYRAVLATSSLDVQDQQCVKFWRDCKSEKEDAGEDPEICIQLCVYTADGAAEAGDPSIVNTQRFTTSEELRDYLAAKYAKYNPAFRLVQSAGVLKKDSDASITSGSEGYNRLVIMETTLDQMNLFAEDNLGFAAYYASHY